MVTALGSIRWVVALAIYTLIFLGGCRALSQIADRRSVQIDQLVQTIESDLTDICKLSPALQESKIQEVKPLRT